jgi:diguanylate cyclase (GGDEF)-like protein
MPTADHAAARPPASDEAQTFDLAPVSLWLEDYSAVRARILDWRDAGMTDLAAWLRADPARPAELAGLVRVLKVNRRTLELYAARDLAELTSRLAEILRDDTFDRFIEEMDELWTSGRGFAGSTVNYSLDGRRLDLQLHGTVLPGHETHWDRVLIAVEDVTERARAERAAARAERYARGLFEHSPVSLWVEDFSVIRRLLEEVRAQGITDFRTFIDVHPEFVTHCMRAIRVMDVNRQTLAMFDAPDKATLLARLPEVFRDEMRPHFAEQLVDLWQGRLMQRREVVNYALSGERLHVYLQFSILPGYETNWELALVSLTDITARKKAEAYLEFLGRHDVLTQLRNRAYFEDELARLERTGPHPVGVLLADLNGLKRVNDEGGHAAGDAMLRRAAEVIGKAAGDEGIAARIGGDEFAILLPGIDARGCVQLEERLATLVELNNQFYQAFFASYMRRSAALTGACTKRRRPGTRTRRATGAAERVQGRASAGSARVGSARVQGQSECRVRDDTRTEYRL